MSILLRSIAICGLIALLALPPARAAGVDDWSVDEVVKWADSAGASSDLQAALRKHSVNGNILAFIDNSDLQDDLGVSSSLERKRFLLAIEKIKVDKDGDGEHDTKMDFWEYRSMNRKTVDHFCSLLATSPRFAISKLKSFPKHGQPANEIGGWAEWILTPEYYLYINSDTMVGGLPGLVPYAIAAHLGAKVLVVLLGFRNGIAGAIGALGGAIFGEVMLGCFAWLYMNLLWPLIPWFLCDWAFYFSIYIGPLLQPIASLVGIVGGMAAEQKLKAN